MNKYIIGLLWVLFFLPAQAADVSEEAMQAQQSDQALCVQQQLTLCIDKCRSREDNHCMQLCKENIKNECRDAGE
ncbi:hypothetical protein [Legionella oakridgensis]|uniref:Cysteine rich repeat protein n=2 Tax=Legionella oakridgensis TaxID=29423 RepID=W0BDZ1_9GAMM|nr:hypothetical protein [Legionella oakridgensis]AHE66911.1 hypothetical protein Loa_01358 [Legionella oakridgensis ATCC 33761 = DSM 21215]ETO93415.1 hypothetical protein LOR_25c02060 [Legionella oakridgensis RV-2-2007]KTD37159.1 hypothetical protein Loak_2295 [Legionella oakridgensis]STY20017.1 Uncharacterised protein [Legionella longbeachae]